jgi:hypothetical protein
MLTDPAIATSVFVLRGDLGAKTGRGFLMWPPTGPPETAHLAVQLSPSLTRSSASP